LYSNKKGCFDNKFNPDKNRDILRLIITAVRHNRYSFDDKLNLFFCIKIGLPEENTDGIKEKIIELYRDLNGIDLHSAQDQFVRQISQSNTYGMIHFELKVFNNSFYHLYNLSFVEYTE
jgi:hypothetical protein